MSNTYKRGTSVRIDAAFTDLDGDPLDPATVTCMVKTPDAIETSYVYGTDSEVVKDGVGLYHLWIDTLPASGTYAYRWKGTDSVDVANEDTFDVDESEFSAP